MKSTIAAACAVLALAAAPARAQVAPSAIGPTVTASDPASVVSALKMAGYRAELKTDNIGDPKILTRLSGREVQLFFYGCDRDTHGGCDQLQFTVGFDADQPLDAARVERFMHDRRFAGMSLDDEGDPWLSWDLVTGTEGIPAAVFLQSVRLFTETVGAAEMMVWPD